VISSPSPYQDGDFFHKAQKSNLAAIGGWTKLGNEAAVTGLGAPPPLGTHVLRRGIIYDIGVEKGLRYSRKSLRFLRLPVFNANPDS
jgi:hypothetical protein